MVKKIEVPISEENEAWLQATRKKTKKKTKKEAEDDLVLRVATRYLGDLPRSR